MATRNDITDKETGELIPVEVFVEILPFAAILIFKTIYLIMIQELKEGEISWAKERRNEMAPHPIIYLAEHGATYFIGCMVTHLDDLGNVKLEIVHFSIKPSNYNDDSYFVNRILDMFTSLVN